MINDTTPTWKSVPEYEGYYEVSSDGQVRSVRHMTKAGWRGGKVLAQFPDKDGYLRVHLSRQGECVSRTVHTLVLSTFVRLPEGDEQCLHGTRGKQCNDVDNLSWGSAQDNSDDKYRDGTMARGERQGNSQLSAEDIAEIFSLRAAGLKQREIGEVSGISQAHVSRILLKQSWAHL